MEHNLDPRSVANLIIDNAINEGKPLPNVSIQKILYFTHAYYLVRYNLPLVKCSFEAWKLGPVCRPIYEALKGWGRFPITSPITKTDPFTGVVFNIALPQNVNIRKHVDKSMESLIKLHPSQLIDLSHAPGGAWAEVWNKSKTSATIGNRISDKLSKEKFGKLKLPIRSDVDEREIDEATPFTCDRSC